MVERLRDHYGIKNDAVLEAMRSVPRHFFVTEALRGRAYDDNALPINFNQTISQPFIVARMTELLEIDKQSRVLEIGAGSGYQTAILARLASQVYAIERIGELAREAQARIRALGIYNATVKAFDGTLGWSAHGPYDAILVAAYHRAPWMYWIGTITAGMTAFYVFRAMFLTFFGEYRGGGGAATPCAVFGRATRGRSAKWRIG